MHIDSPAAAGVRPTCCTCSNNETDSRLPTASLMHEKKWNEPWRAAGGSAFVFYTWANEVAVLHLITNQDLFN